uniref:Haloalkane dehalogenase-like n=1 Tax=Hirondellea gigas TaxID=1518452 RepID=A0A6A7FP86_9CRUS
MDPLGLLIRLVVLPIVILLFAKLNLIKLLIILTMKLLFKREQDIVVRTPDDRFIGLDKLGYTFAPHYASLPAGGGKTLPRVHYVDEGPRDAKETVLCLHGEPSWSFLYRRVVPGLVAAGYRVVVPDFIGFGKSDKYTHPESYTHDLHTMTLRLLLEHLKLSNITLMCQDWGGLTGLTVVKDCPQLFSRLVIMNTGLPSGKDFKPWNLYAITPFLTWRSFAQFVGTAMPIKFVFKMALDNPSSEVLQAYNAPFSSMSHRGGAARWPLLVPITSGSLVSGEMRHTTDFLQNKWKSPVLIMFSDDDAITGGQEKIFKAMLPHAKQVTIRGGGHFLQEAKGEELAVNVVKFIKESN